MCNVKCVRLPTSGTIGSLKPTDYIPRDTVQSGDPQERGLGYYTDQTGQLDSGVWECEVNKHVIESAPYDEFVYLLEGRIDIIDGAGEYRKYKAYVI